MTNQTEGTTLTENTQRRGNFVHLHTHTEYSSGVDGLGRVMDVFASAAADGQPAAAQTDHGKLTGAWSWKMAAAKHGLKAIYGVEAYLAIGSRHEKNSRLEDREDADTDFDEEQVGKAQQDTKEVRYEHLTVLARNTTGWKNLVKMQNEAQNSYWYHPRIDYALLKEYGEGLIVLTGCLGGPVAGRLKHVRGVDPEQDAKYIAEAKANIRALIDAVGRENVYVEIMEHGIDVEADVLMRLIDIAHTWTDENGNPDPLPLVVTNDAHFVGAGDCDAHDAWLAVKTKTVVGNQKRFKFHGEGYHLRTEAEMRALGGVVFAREAEKWIKSHLDFISEIDEFKAAYETVATQCDPEVTGNLRRGIGVKQWVEAATSLYPAAADLINAWWDEARADAFAKRIPQLVNIWNAACDMTVTIADRCDDEVLESPGTLLPQYPVPEGFADSKAYLHSLLVEGAERRYGRDANGMLPQDVRERLAMEFKTVNDMGFPDYFLIVWDLINWANSDLGQPEPGFPRGRPGGKKPILTGPGRGSAAGSLMAYCLDITDLCPLKFDLLFERFLEPGRADMPDMDLDFEAARRWEVQMYLTLRWGMKNVAKIGTFQTAKSKSALEDAGRVYELQESTTPLKKLIPEQGGKPLPFKALLDPANPMGADFRAALEKADEEAREKGNEQHDLRMLLETAILWEDTVTNEAVHACGMLVAPIDLTQEIPLRYDRAKDAPKDADGNPTQRVTLWDSKQVEKYGMLKLDVLAIDNLDFMSKAFEFIEMTTGRVLTMKGIPEPDSGDPTVDAVWELLQSGKTAGIFQLESDGMTGLIEQMSVSTFEDLSAAVALFRPGPLSADMHTRYVERKAGREPVDYGIFTNDPAEQAAIATVLDETYGVFCYQEQVMQLGLVMAGFDAGQRSALRRAIGKKDKVMMAEVGEKFLTGCEQEFRDETGNLISMRFSRATAERMWDYFKGSADYLFNKSHSAAYGKLAYHTAWLKANYPIEYGAAILSVTNKAEKRFRALRNLESEGIEVLPPDVNLSMAGTAPEMVDGKATGKIRFGLTEIRDVGVSGLHVYRERARGGEFENLNDLMRRVKLPEVAEHTEQVVDTETGEILAEPAGKKLGITAVEALIESGACDRFGPRLGLMRIARASADIVFDVPDNEWPVVMRSMLQRRRLSMAVGEHPLVAEADFLAKWVTPSGSTDDRGRPLHGVKPVHIDDSLDKGTQVVLGVVSQFEIIQKAKGRFASFSIEGPNGTLDGRVWYERLAQMIDNNEYLPRVGDVVAVSGWIKIREVEREVATDSDANINAADADAVATVTETVIHREMSASMFWPIDIPHETGDIGVNTFGGAFEVPTPSGGTLLFALGAPETPETLPGSDSPALVPSVAHAGADGGSVAVLDRPKTATAAVSVTSARAGDDFVWAGSAVNGFGGADCISSLAGRVIPKEVTTAKAKHSVKRTGPALYVNEANRIVVLMLDMTGRSVEPEDAECDMVDALTALLRVNPSINLREVAAGDLTLAKPDENGWIQIPADMGKVEALVAEHMLPV
ncbi:DNA polymerase III subunit alpha [Aeromicrobium sp. 179-A 4D2 NHS]|uniref:DNA polymerase III subunit alpha n=1 Tax=Aeromicrobium sp. 179-A 4D2 NHS TaxID=3142375 RepID=UPI0039A2151B